MFPFRRLVVWQRSHAAALAAYQLARQFPREERFALAAQLRRAAISVPINIAEGSRRVSPREFARFLNIAEGSASETEYVVEFAAESALVPSEPAQALVVTYREISMMLFKLRKRLMP